MTNSRATTVILVFTFLLLMAKLQTPARLSWLYVALPLIAYGVWWLVFAVLAMWIMRDSRNR